ncbi:diguanylate cyclase/phosphodiesterase with PAS/PAC sensor(s) [Roseovarius nanhaiticus]|uniref:Diguanylate cyclase/phosphodiesterase with PAS/PAC sensor(S) n=1 Tax=Roseovarius nanhaiticus TaxID=573024 RepID=A0A1N7FL16_9RHOB|nr:diguanylate cyclase/phosphodiesterase with PAS/PAC sensor(s) [Roseovarius nanhaiticus]SIS00926.1 diguanylate cyclase/phosphodiesterase with PAS/PAC sensor(s) [Roseovarius nanhaiticus]
MQQVGDGVSPGRQDHDDARGQSCRAAVSGHADARGGGAAHEEAGRWSEPWLSQLILDHARDGIAVLDMAGRMRWMNPALERMLGWSLAEMRGRNPSEMIMPPETRPAPEALARFRYAPGSPIFDTYRVTRHMRRDGSRFWNQQSHALIDLGPSDSEKMVVVTCRDISTEIEVQTDLRRVKDDLEHAAHHDDLTGLGNRKKLSQFLASGTARDSLRRGCMGVLQLDMDRFKEINDTLGHDAGDAVLRHVAAALREAAGEDDLACRMGGDEFVLICPDIGSRSSLVRRAEAILTGASRPLRWRDQTIMPGISIGASMPGHEGSGSSTDGMETPATLDGETLIRQADQALYSAKEAGRGRAILYTPELGRRHRDEQQISRDLSAAVEHEQLCVHLQPIAHLGTNRITGCEALLRWRHPTRGLLHPATFLPAAHQTQLLSEIDYLAMNAALDALADLHAQGFADLGMSLNVSSSILVDADYPALLDWALQSRDLPAHAICIEVLETAMMMGGALDVTGAITRLRALGVRVALDDFGSGYAGLTHMSSVEIDAIKLDRTMVCRLGRDPRARVVTRAIIRLCAVLGMDVIASGVETQTQVEVLRRAKCPQVQGFGLARPMDPSAMVEWLRARASLDGPLVLPDTPNGADTDVDDPAGNTDVDGISRA